jgi:PPM family protein phosphatase
VLGILGLAWMGGVLAWSWSQHQYYVGDQDGVVTIFRGVNADVPGIDLSHPYETSNVRLDQLTSFNAGQVQQGIGASSLYDAERTVQRLASNQAPTSTGGG